MLKTVPYILFIYVPLSCEDERSIGDSSVAKVGPGGPRNFKCLPGALPKELILT